MKIIISQGKKSMFVLNTNQYINVSTVEVEEVKYFSLGIAGVSFGLYNEEKQAMHEFNRLIEFLVSDEREFYVA